MTAAFKAKLSTTRKFVLLALCDAANDQGECYPSVTNLMEKCSASERTIQAAINELERDGFLRRDFRTGRSTVYWIADPRNWRTPAADAPPQQLPSTPAIPAPLPPQLAHPTPATGAPITVNEPSVEPKTKTKRASAPVSVPVSALLAAGFSEPVALEFIAHKDRVRAPLTARAWVDHLSESAKSGWTPLMAAEKVMAKSWKGFEARYVAGEAKPGQPPPSETAYARQMREKWEQVAPDIAAKRPGTANVIEMEPRNVTAPLLG